MKNRFYLKHNSRLADVLAMIQILAFYEAVAPTEKGMIDKAKGPPRSAKKWEDVAEQHPEFFRLSPGTKEKSISLIARHAQTTLENGNKTLELDFIEKLMETAIRLHDSQLNSSRWWTFCIPLIGSFIGVLVAQLFTK